MSTQTADIDLGVVLVVGGSGFVGRHCLRNVQQNGGANVEVHTMNSRLPPPEKRLPGVTYHAADIADASAVEATIKTTHPQVILHLACPKPIVERREVYDAVNINGTRNLLAACDRVSSVRALVYCSSVSVVDHGKGNIRNADESWPVLFTPEQKVYYFHSKAMAETLILQHNRKNSQKMLTTALRVTSIFGEEDNQIIGANIARAKSGELKTQIGDGSNLMDWTYVGTVAAAHTHAAKRLLQASASSSSPAPPESRVEGEAFFVTNAEPRPFFEFGRQIAKQAGFPVREEEIKKLPAFMAWVIGFIAEWLVFLRSWGRQRPTVTRQHLRYCVIDHYFSNEKARRQLGFVPEVGIDEAITRSVEWYKQSQKSAQPVKDK